VVVPETPAAPAGPRASLARKAPRRDSDRPATGPPTLVIRPDKEPGAWLPGADARDQAAADRLPTAGQAAAERDAAEQEAAAVGKAAEREAAAASRAAAQEAAAVRKAAEREAAAASRAAARQAAAVRRAAARDAAAARGAAAATALGEAAAQTRHASAEAFRRAGARLQPDDFRRAAQAGTRSVGQAGSRLRQATPESLRGTASQARRTGADALQRMLRLRTSGRRLSWIVGVLAILLAGLIVLIYALTSGGPRPAGAARSGHAAASGHPAASRPGPTATRGSTPPAASAAGPLTPASARPFGPRGAADGDNPQHAPHVISGGVGGGWDTNWYATAGFGGLQSGTGLLLDLGSADTVTSATIELGPGAGSSLQLRAGSTPALGDLRTVASASGVGGTVTLRPRPPVRARYLLIWFTKLPRDRSGTYQAAIRQVSLAGIR
jgi:hypothetical protein